MDDAIPDCRMTENREALSDHSACGIPEGRICDAEFAGCANCSCKCGAGAEVRRLRAEVENYERCLHATEEKAAALQAENERLRADSQTFADTYARNMERVRAENERLKLENDRWREWSGVVESPLASDDMRLAEEKRVTAIPPEGGSLTPRAVKPDYKIEDRGYDTPCWIWQKNLNDTGYGQGSFTSIGITTKAAHRAYYMVANGVRLAPLYEDGVIDHLCRNPPCVNPAHLELVRPSENTQRGDAAKITMDDAREIRRRIVAGETMTPLAEEYGVSIHTIHWIAEDIMWREDYNAPRQPVRPAGVVCAECGEPITSGKRNKRFCSKKHRDLFNGRRSSRARRGQAPDGALVGPRLRPTLPSRETLAPSASSDAQTARKETK